MGDNNDFNPSDIFNLNKKIKTITIRSGAVMGRSVVEPGVLRQTPHMKARPAYGQDYAMKYVEEEEEALLKGMKFNASPTLDLPDSNRDELCEMEDCTSIGSFPNLNDFESEEALKVYDRYDFSAKTVDEPKLPIEGKRKLIIDMVQTNPVVVILGATGCGKTTLVPQFILDHHAKERTRCNIVVTQPRRIAAASVAKRVCDIRGWELSRIVGYQIGLDNKTSEDTRLTFCTTGVLREKFVRDRNMTAYTHVIIDEVHERDIETDFLMLMVRKFLRSNSRAVKVILMSATIDPSRFARYFSTPVGQQLYPAPVLEVEKETRFTVEVFHIQELHNLGPPPKFDVEEPQVHEEVLHITVKLIEKFDEIDLPVDGFQFKNKREPTPTDNYKGAVLVFLPGIHEIETLHERLMDKKRQEKYLWHILVLHSSISREQQNQVFLRPQPGFRKIILSTNIAESSITVPDIVYVIDLCLTKHLVCDPVTNFTSLCYAWASHANCKQRAGRAGRVKEGRVYRMVPKYFFENSLPAETAPEMVRCPLTQTVLKAKQLKMGPPKAVLAGALDPPDLSRLQTTVLVLKEAGALLKTVEGKYNELDGDLTFLGIVMACLPLDIQFSKMIMLGNAFSILDDAIVMAAWMTVRSVFKTDFYDRLGPYGAKIKFAGGSRSDCITYLNVHHVFTDLRRTNYFKTSNDSEEGWCKRNFLNFKSMLEANELVEELRKRLQNIGVSEIVAETRPTWTNAELPTIREVVMAGAFYPNYFIRGAQAGQVNEEDAVKALGGKDPFSTVYLQNMPANEPSELYAKAIKDIFDCYAGVVSNVSFDGSSKVYIEFERQQNDDQPGKISCPVYRAVKMRQLRIPIEIPALTQPEGRKRMEQYGLVSDRFLSLGKVKGKRFCRLPNLSVQDIEFVTCYVNDPNSFWIHHAVESDLESYQSKLNTPGNVFFLSGKPKVGSIYAAPYPQNSQFLFRAQIISEDKGYFMVLFIDYGNVDGKMPMKYLYELGPNIQDLKYLNCAPPCALECTLTGICFPPLENRWAPQTIELFQKLISNKKLFGEIYSVVDERLSLTVKHPGSQKSLNQYLVDKGLAVTCEESVRSKKDNNNRLNARSFSSSSFSCGVAESELKVLDVQDNIRKVSTFVEPPSREECSRLLKLRGPSSPLEMSVYGCSRISAGRSVAIDLESVNSVLLDTDPEDPHERLLVAGYVGSNSSGSKLKISHTTLMPRVHGLAALMCIIFSPCIELRLSKDKTRYIGAICGLGYDMNTGESYFPENEMEITFDCLIDINDMQEVNRLRYWISRTLEKDQAGDVCDATINEILKSQEKVHEIFLNLWKRDRPSQEVEMSFSPYCWKAFDPADLLHPDFDGPLCVYPPHYALAAQD